MCGIDTLVSKNYEQVEGHQKNLLITQRGPDAFDQVKIRDEISLSLASSTLHLRGDHCVIQPVDDNDFILQWNGEIYQGIDIDIKENDTIHLFETIKRIGIVEALQCISGEFAFVIYNKSAKRLYYGRDRFGRRSLLIHQTLDSLHICSVAPLDAHHYSYKEVPANGIYYLDLKHDGLKNDLLATWNVLLSKFTALPDVESMFIKLIQRSVSRRILSIPSISAGDYNQYSPVALLFSGGIDSVMLAAFIDDVLPPGISIDLLNVAFANEKFLLNSKQRIDNIFHVPDRISGLYALHELKRRNPHRQWNFVNCDVPKTEYENRKNHIIKLLKPTDTVMDLSIGAALWFAARGEGILHEQTTSLYKSQAKVIIVGMGADEQLGGYSRHRSAFQNGGYPAVQQEMKEQLNRIWLRNMGRDDRCVGDHGKEARFPFLDEELVTFLNSLPANVKCDFDLPKGQGEKWLLRKVALTMGFSKEVAFLPKRAIQFGAKTAKLDGNMEGGASLSNL